MNPHGPNITGNPGKSQLKITGNPGKIGRCFNETPSRVSTRSNHVISYWKIVVFGGFRGRLCRICACGGEGW